MSIEKVYDRGVGYYNQSLSAFVVEKAGQSAFETYLKAKKTPINMLALGIGDGKFMLPYQKAYPKAILSGLDISSNMLISARQLLGCKTYHGCIADANKLIQNQKFDLIMAHFVCAYVSPEVILNESQQLLSETGIISIVSNTLSSFPNLMALYQKHIKGSGFLKNALKRHVDKSLLTVHVPKSTDDLAILAEKEGLVVIEKNALTIDICFNNDESFIDFFMNAGWFANGLVHPLVPQNVIQYFFKKLVKNHMQFPFTDTLDISVLLAKRQK